MINALEIVLIFFGVAIGVACVVGLVSPDVLIRFVKRAWDNQSGMYFAVVVRVLLGAVALVAAVGIAVMGRDRVGRLIAMFEGFPHGLVRVWLVFGGAFGGFLIYGIW
jgi:hypothetical protein